MCGFLRKPARVVGIAGAVAEGGENAEAFAVHVDGEAMGGFVVVV